MLEVREWPNCLSWSDRFCGAVGADFPVDLLPPDTGLILADGYGGEIVRMAPETPLAGARRKVTVQKFARHAAMRLQAARDPGISLSGAFP